MNYCKITNDKTALQMPNPFCLSVANPNEETKAILANLDGWLPMEHRDKPFYNEETHYAADYWEEEEGKAVQKWEILEKPAAEAELTERVDSLEQNLSDLLDGVTE